MKPWKETKLYSVVNIKCPRCHEGDMFPPHTLYKLSKFDKMYSACPCCGQTYEPEPGYYYGAMFVSFSISTGIFLAVLFGLSFFVEEITLAMLVGTILIIVVALLPVNFRLARAIWINIFMRYEGPCQQLQKK